MTKHLIILCLAIFSTSALNSQTTFNSHKAGHTFNIDLPNYMVKTSGLNSVASIQYKSILKNLFGIVIMDTKEELELAEIMYPAADDFYKEFIVDFLKDEKKRSISEPIRKEINGVNFIEVDASYYD